ncbi:MAG TPA: hypothetical protein VFY17_09235 [Pilimelia sp.]|nr:hypothetical protein [Pilimelia sp.]
MKEDEIVRPNPCRIKGYGHHHTPERPTATTAQVYALADALLARFSALVVAARCPGCAGASWSRCAGGTSTSTPAPCG